MILTTLIVSLSEYNQLLLFIKQNAKVLFIVILVSSLISNSIKTNNQKLKDSIFMFFIILWASFWFVCFEASYVPLYAEGQCLKGEYFDKDNFVLELKNIKYNDSFGFMKYDVQKLFQLQKKYKRIEFFQILKKNEQGYIISNKHGLELFIPVYEDVAYSHQKCFKEDELVLHNCKGWCLANAAPFEFNKYYKKNGLQSSLIYLYE